MTDLVRIILQGGLGNQLFQYAAGLSIIKKTGGKLWLGEAQYNKHSGRDYRKQLYKRGCAIGLDGNPEVLERPHIQSDAFERWNQTKYMNMKHLSLQGYFQYLPAIQDEVAIISNDLLESLSDIRNNLSKKYSIEDTKNTAFLHIRRNDYLNHPTLHWTQGKDYYTRGIDIVNNGKPLRWLVLSDDTTWCKQQDWLNRDGLEIVNEPDELHGLMLMSLCRAGAVIANSSYSWWGAMLGSAKVNSPVVYPLKWFKDDKPDLFLQGWVGL